MHKRSNVLGGIEGGKRDQIPFETQSLSNGILFLFFRPMKWNWIVFHGTPGIVSPHARKGNRQKTSFRWPPRCSPHQNCTCFPKPGSRRSPGCWWRQPTVTCTCTTWIPRRAANARSWSSTGEAPRPTRSRAHVGQPEPKVVRKVSLLSSGWTAALSQPVRFWTRGHMIGRLWRRPTVLPSQKVSRRVSSKYLKTGIFFSSFSFCSL